MADSLFVSFLESKDPSDDMKLKSPAAWIGRKDTISTILKVFFTSSQQRGKEGDNLKEFTGVIGKW